MQSTGTPDERAKEALNLWEISFELCLSEWDTALASRRDSYASFSLDLTPDDPRAYDLALLAALQPTGTPTERVRAAWEVWSAALSLRNKCRTLPPGVQRIEAAAARADDPTRRLRQQENGNWQLRITLTTDPRKSGSRKIISLQTTDLEEAKKNRDFAEHLFNSAGVLKNGAKAGIE
jgi:hypothetical protein